MLFKVPTDKTVSETAATLKPTILLALFNTPQLKNVAHEVEDTIVKIMTEASQADSIKQ